MFSGGKEGDRWSFLKGDLTLTFTYPINVNSNTENQAKS